MSRNALRKIMLHEAFFGIWKLKSLTNEEQALVYKADGAWILNPKSDFYYDRRCRVVGPVFRCPFCHKLSALWVMGCGHYVFNCEWLGKDRHYFRYMHRDLLEGLVDKFQVTSKPPDLMDLKAQFRIKAKILKRLSVLKSSNGHFRPSIIQAYPRGLKILFVSAKVPVPAMVTSSQELFQNAPGVFVGFSALKHIN